MNFRATLARHLQAIRTRNLQELAATVAEEGLVLMEVEIFESGDLAVAVLRLDYREPPAVRSFLTLYLSGAVANG